MDKVTLLVVAIIFSLLLAACGGATPAQSQAAAVAPAQAQTVAQSSVGALNAEYQDALPVEAQLILGSLKLEDGDLAISADEAKQLLPLWQAYQSLGNSDNTAEVELAALVKQIEKAMQPAQVEAIGAMQLTSADVTEFMQSQGPEDFGGFRGAGRGGGNGEPGGFMPPPGGGAFIPGEGPGGGVGGGPGGQQVSPEQRATAIAQRMAENPRLAASFLTRGIMNQLITTLQLKTGDVTQQELQAEREQRAAMRWVPVAAEATGIAVEKLSAAMRDGKTLAEAIQAEGGDVTKAEAAIREMLKNAPNTNADTLEEQVSAALNAKGSPLPAPPPSQ